MSNSKTIGYIIIIIIMGSLIYIIPTSMMYFQGNHLCNKYCNESYGGKYSSDFPFLYKHYKCEQHEVIKKTQDYCQDEDGFYQHCKTYRCDRLIST